MSESRVHAATLPGRWAAGPPVGWVALGIAGLAVLAVSIVARAVGDFHWWSEFITVPGAVIAAAGMPLLTRGGDRGLFGYLVCWCGALIVLVGVLLMFGAMGDGWPTLISAPALTVAGTYFWHADDPLPRGLHRTVVSLALLAFTLGGVFLAMQAGWSGFSNAHWWGGYMIAAGGLVLLNSVDLLRHRMRYGLQAATLMAGPGVLTILLGLRFLRNLTLP